MSLRVKAKTCWRLMSNTSLKRGPRTSWEEEKEGGGGAKVRKGRGNKISGRRKRRNKQKKGRVKMGDKMKGIEQWKEKKWRKEIEIRGPGAMIGCDPPQHHYHKRRNPSRALKRMKSAASNEEQADL